MGIITDTEADELLMRLYRKQPVSKRELLNIREYIRSLRDDRAILQKENSHLKVIDPLTHLYNRRGLTIELQKAVTRAKVIKYQDNIHLAYIDVDNFKRFNDTTNHSTGDKLLRAIGKSLRDGVKLSDKVARPHGDEFAIIFYNANDVMRIKERLEEIIDDSDEQLRHIDPERIVSFSAGIRTITREYTATQLLQQADDAMCAAKYAGKNRVEIWSPDIDYQSIRKKIPSR